MSKTAVEIKTFKDQICESLAEYNQHIEDLKKGMEEATNSADKIRKVPMGQTKHRGKHVWICAWRCAWRYASGIYI